MAGKQHKNLLGRMVEVTWDDPTAWTNEDLRDTKLSRCISWGILREARSDYIVLQTAKYESSALGDFTTINVGCVVNVKVYRPRRHLPESD